ncbi:uncharacterized protein LOC121425257 [Lytechinus variegatus]|uniref:uncharacterized protein LOC121425257 n=1 Tax=Lytechinus variegatus TaxID=7654 RepID=UPI001BB11C76|nr:uncharacterized protein LOC121425257 [Lytechinus variegatus]
MAANYRRMKNWEDAEVRCFLNFWADQEVQKQLDGTVRNKKVFRDISERMNKAGFSRTPEQLRDKLKKLKKDYKDAKANNNTSGAARVQCPFYDEIHAVLGNRPSIEPQVLIDTAQESDMEEPEELEPDSNTVGQDASDNSGKTEELGLDEDEAKAIEVPPDAGPSTSTPKTNVPVKPKKRKQASSNNEEGMEMLVKRMMDDRAAAAREQREWEEEREEAHERREDRRRREEREHEIRLFQMLGAMFQHSNQQQNQQGNAVMFTPDGRSFMDM